MTIDNQPGNIYPLFQKHITLDEQQIKLLLTTVTRLVTYMSMIKTFADKHTRELYISGKSKRLPGDILKRALRRLEYLDYATCIEDFRVPPSNKLEKLGGDRLGQYSIRINDQWRICFRFVDADAYDVEIIDYH